MTRTAEPLGPRSVREPAAGGPGHPSPPVAAEELIRSRARAYDRVYSRWHAKRITREGYERWNRFFLDSATAGEGRLNGDELQCAFALLGLDQLAGKTVLDYCCGTGLTSIYLALHGAAVHALDASRQAIAIARESARLSGVEDRVSFSVMDAQRLAFRDAAFDAIFCESALHIVIDYPRCPWELARVLKPGGCAVFCQEALGHNPLMAPLRWLRRRKHRPCGGRTLTCEDLAAFGRAFDRTEIYYFNLLTQLKMMIEPVARSRPGKAILRRCQAIDRVLLSRSPKLRRYAGKIVVRYRKMPWRTPDAPNDARTTPDRTTIPGPGIGGPAAPPIAAPWPGSPSL